jgi:hypothetical protein
MPKFFILNIDASCVGPGAVLYQEVKGKEKVVAYASHGLRPSEPQLPCSQARVPFLEVGCGGEII